MSLNQDLQMASCQFFAAAQPYRHAVIICEGTVVRVRGVSSVLEHLSRWSFIQSNLYISNIISIVAS